MRIIIIAQVDIVHDRVHDALDNLYMSPIQRIKKLDIALVEIEKLMSFVIHIKEGIK